jgi:predicted Zn finger-like uncharacterized protein
MAKYGAVHFNCPSCNTLYHVVKAEAGPVTINRWVTCGTCHEPIPPAKANSSSNTFFCGRRRARISGRVRALSGQVSREALTKPWTSRCRFNLGASNVGWRSVMTSRTASCCMRTTASECCGRAGAGGNMQPYAVPTANWCCLRRRCLFPQKSDIGHRGCAQSVRAFV